MQNYVRVALVLSTAFVLSIAGCNKDKEKSEPATPAAATAPETKPEPTKPTKPEKPAMPAMPDKSADVAHAAEVWTAAKTYRDWNKVSDAPVASEKPHGAFVHVFYNDAAKGGIGADGAWPDGSIFVKDNFMPNDAKDGPGMLGAVTVMHKEGERWFWAKFKKDGSLHQTPADAKMPNMPIAGYEKLKCIGCHSSKKTRDMVVTTITAAKK